MSGRVSETGGLDGLNGPAFGSFSTTLDSVRAFRTESAVFQEVRQLNPPCHPTHCSLMRTYGYTNENTDL